MVTNPQPRHAGAFAAARGGWIMDGGTWKPFFSDATKLGQFGMGAAVNAHQVSDTNVADWQALGIKYVRHTLYWSLHVSDASYRTTFATAVNKMLAGGIRPLIVVHSAPTDLSATATTAQRTQFAKDFGTFVAARAAEFPGCDWQLWNEMDSGWTTAFGYGSGLTTQQQGALYGTHFAIVAPMIRAADPSALVVTGGSSAASTVGAWHTGMISTLGSVLPDAFCVHAYGEPPFYQVGLWTDAARAAFGVAIPIWITETGISTGGMNSAWGITGGVATIERNRQIRHTLMFAKKKNIARLYWYVWEGNDGFEIVRSNGTLEPAVDAFVEFTQKNSVMYDKPGTYSFIVPTGVSQIRVSVQGAGGGGQAGGATAGIGGNGGSHVYGGVLNVSAGQQYVIVVGAGGAGGVVGGSAPTAGGNSTLTLAGGGTITANGGGVGGAAEPSLPTMGLSPASHGPGRGQRATDGYGANSFFGAGGWPGAVNGSTVGTAGVGGSGGGAGSHSATAGLRANGGPGGDGFVLIEWGTLRLLPTLTAVVTGYDAPNASNIITLTSAFQNPNNRPGKVEIYWRGIGGTDEGGLLSSSTFSAGTTSNVQTHLRHQDFGTGGHVYRARVYFSLDGGTTYTDGPHPSANWANA